MVKTQIVFSQKHLSPPVFVAGSFTRWQTVEMEWATRDSQSATTQTFSKTLDIPPGEHQFKFRLGQGDWWVVDDNVPTTRDAVGNLNNVLTIQPEPVAPVDEHSTQDSAQDSRQNSTRNSTPNSTQSSTQDSTQDLTQDSTQDLQDQVEPRPGPVIKDQHPSNHISPPASTLPPARPETASSTVIMPGLMIAGVALAAAVYFRSA